MEYTHISEPYLRKACLKNIQAEKEAAYMNNNMISDQSVRGNHGIIDTEIICSSIEDFLGGDEKALKDLLNGVGIRKDDVMTE